jgi:hypothetical protein
VRETKGQGSGKTAEKEKKKEKRREENKLPKLRKTNT